MCERASVRLPRVVDAVAQARAWVTDALRPWLRADCGDVVDATRLSVSELVTNAVRYGEGDITVDLTLHTDAVELAVADAGPGEPRPRCAGPSAESGRGLTLVDAFTERWGVRRLPRGKAVWCRVPLGGACAATCRGGTARGAPPTASLAPG